MKNIISKFHLPISILFSCLIFIYVLYRAYTLSFTYDEIITFENARESTPIMDFISANNHILNTFFCRINFSFFQFNEFGLRIPNVISYLVYAYASYKISRHFEPPHALMLFITLNCSTFLLDFFSILRGYSFGISFMMLSLAFTLELHVQQKKYFAWLSIFASILAVIGSFSVVNYFIPNFLVIVFVLFLGGDSLKQKLLQSSFITLVVAIFLAVILPFLLALKNNGHLFFGGRENFFSDVILSVSRCQAYFAEDTVTYNLFVYAFISSIAIAIFNVINYFRNKQFGISFFIACIFLLSILSSIAQFVLFKTLYPVERTGLIYIPFIFINISIAIGGLQPKFGNYLFAIFLVIFMLHFVRTANTKIVYSWRYDSASNDVDKYLQDHKLDNIKLGVEYIHMPSVHYYRKKYFMPLLEIVEVTKGCYIFPYNMEEVNPYFYGSTYNNDNDILAVLKKGIIYYYLDDYVVNELRQSSIDITILQHYAHSRSSLIKVNNQ